MRNPVSTPPTLPEMAEIAEALAATATLPDLAKVAVALTETLVQHGDLLRLLADDMRAQGIQVRALTIVCGALIGALDSKAGSGCARRAMLDGLAAAGEPLDTEVLGIVDALFGAGNASSEDGSAPVPKPRDHLRLVATDGRSSAPD